MTDLLVEFARLSPLMVWTAVVAAFTMAAAVVVERAAFGVQQALSRRVRGATVRSCSVRSRETKRREASSWPVPRDIGSPSRGC